MADGDLSGRRLLHYQVMDRLGKGGMGEVWLAKDTKLGRTVALKTLGRGAEHAMGRERFLREAQAASALSHPNIITIHEINSDDGVDFMVMELIKGRSLQQLLDVAALPLAQALDYSMQICSALATAHEAGIVHRDLKPSNVMITETGMVKVLDFGIAKMLRKEAAASGDSTAGYTLTATGMTIGTAGTMSPEQALGDDVDGRSDIYSLGVLMYHMVTGRPPFEGSSQLTLMRKVVYEDPRPPRELAPAIPAQLDALIMKCLAKEPADRYQNVPQVVGVLRQFTAATSNWTAASLASSTETAEAIPVPARKVQWKWIVLAAGILAAIGIGAFWSKRQSAANPDVRLEAELLEGSARELTQRARTLLSRYDKRGNTDAAVKVLEKAIERDKEFAPAYAALAEAYYWKGTGSSDPHFLNLAEIAAKQGVSLNPDLAAAQAALGAVSLERNQRDVAQMAVTKALDLDPRNQRALITQARMLATADPVKAEAAYKHAVELGAQDWIPKMEYAVFLTRKERHKEASALMEECTRLVPDNAKVWQNLGGSYHLQDRYEEAVSALQKGLEIDSSGRMWSNLGTTRFFQGRYADTATAFEKALEFEPNNYLYWANLADALRWTPSRKSEAAGNYKHAIELLDKRIERTPDDLELKGRRVLYQAKMGDPAVKTAAAKLDQSKTLSAANSYRLAVVFEITGHRKAALGHLSEAIDKKYPMREIRNDPELGPLRNDVAYHRLIAAKAVN